MFKPLLEHESWLGLIPAEHVQRPGTDRMATIGHNIALQYARRILFNDPGLSLKAVGKVSFKDLLLDDDFSFEDVVNFVRMWEMRMGFGLVWWKDSTLEALAMLLSNGEHINAANVGDPSEFDYIYAEFGGLNTEICQRIDSQWSEAGSSIGRTNEQCRMKLGG